MNSHANRLFFPIFVYLYTSLGLPHRSPTGKIYLLSHMKSLKTLALGTALPLCAAAAAQTSTPQNVIFILMDDAGLGDFGCYGQTRTETPNIDALAREGILFRNMYSCAPISSPSRCCLLTGQHTGHSQVRANKEGNGPGDVWDFEAVFQDPALEGQAPMAEGTQTLGTMMQKAGYRTAMIGKWGVGGPTTCSTPNKMGFDFYYGCICQRLAHNYYGPYLWRDSQKEFLNREYVNPGTALDQGADPRKLSSYDKYSKGKVYGPDVMFEEVTKFVDQNAERPFFLMWTTPLPHSPLQAPQRWVDHYVQKFGDEDPLQVEFHPGTSHHNYFPCRYPHATYAAMISYFDEQVGELVKQLKRLGIYENTVIFFTSDNGPANNASSPTEWFDSAKPFRCGKGWAKGTLHEGGLRMPFIVSWPGRTPRGMESHHIGYFADVMPTLAQIAGTEAPQNDGISLVPLLEGNSEKQLQHDYLYWEYPRQGGQIAVRMGNWKGLVQNYNKGSRTMELYDLSHEAHDTESWERNQAAAHPQIVEKMWKAIKESHRMASEPEFRMKEERKK